ncbi:MAG: hypothetical protein IPH52_15475 [Leptospiraceae bacterium]|nr:hypothetical protein [Leptospiraceae bacterium]
MQEAFRRTKADISKFQPKQWAKDINGKSGVVEWKGFGGAEVSIDAQIRGFRCISYWI